MPKKPDHDYIHVKVPGFGCTYPNDFKDGGGACTFELRRLVRDESVKFDGRAPAIVLPIEAARGVIKPAGDKPIPVDYEGLVVLPAGGAWSLVATTPILKVLMIGVREPALAASGRDFGLEAGALRAAFTAVRRLTRTTWIEELCHRYAFERSIAKQPESAAARFLESELIKEVFYAVSREAQRDHDVPFFVELPEPLRRALTYIEQHLHDELNAETIAAVAVTSQPTLVRLFRKHLHASPIKYLWGRRLDEADRLLLTGRYTVAEVAALLGFSDSSAFSKGFLERFGVRPSARLPG